MKTFKDTKYGDLTGQVYEGDIYVYKKELDSLEGAPKEVHGDFICYNNNLKSLEGAPKIVEGNFDCTYNKLPSLKGVPELVTGYFDCSDCSKLTSLDELLDTEIRGELYNDIMLDKEFRELQTLYRKANKNMKKYELLKKLKDIK